MPVERASARSIVGWTGSALSLGWAAARWPLLGVTGLAVLDGALPVGAAWSLRLLLDSLTSQPASHRGAVFAVIAIVLCGFASLACKTIQLYLDTVLQRRMRITVEARLFRAIHSVDSLAHFEDPAKLDQLRLAERAGESAPTGVLTSGLGLAQAMVTGAGFVGTVLLLCPWLVPVVLVAAIPTCWLQLRLARLRADVLMDTSVYHRRLIFYRYLAIDVRAAKEVRLFGLGDFLVSRMLRDLGSCNDAEAAVDRSAARIELVIGLFAGLVTLCGAVAATVLALHHRLSVGDVTVLLAGVAALQALVSSVTENASLAYRSLLMFSQYLAVADQGGAPAPGTGDVGPLRDAIEFDDVWFRYADDLPWVLRGVSCRLPAGQAVGLVGLNGAGKTTMIKLLCRLYEPTRGCIRWDGVDLRTLDPQQLRRRLSAVFQDFMAYDFTAADNIAVGSMDALGDAERIRQAAERAGADRTIEKLPHGYQTMLSRIFPADEAGARTATLSGGEWQRLALARAFLRSDSDLLILDEPSSGLDAQVEYALHRTLEKMRSGRLSLLISHRLNTLTSADLVLVLDQGQIVEQGKPAELAAAGGPYAELFALQAEGYQLPVPAAGTPAGG